LKRLIFVFLIILLSINYGYSEEISFTLNSSVNAANPDIYMDGGISDLLGADFLLSGDFYNIDVNISMVNDGMYVPHSLFQLGHYFYSTGSMANMYFGDFEIIMGRGVHTDVVDSPYALYINPNAEPAFHAEMSYTGDMFSYSSRWVRLNERSSQTYNGDIDLESADTNYLRDRGMTFKTYALNLGDLKFGVEDVSVYLDRSFDAESFLNPFPLYFLEMIMTTDGRPWSELNNTNSLMGFFAEYKMDDIYLEGQILVDDLNAGILAPVLGWAIPALTWMDNLSKIAWSFGGAYDSSLGRMGFYHGGALKYTFESTYSDPAGSGSYSTLPYEYTYYPITEFDTGVGYSPLDYTKNYIGYTYGENNISFLVDYENRVFPGEPQAFDLYASLEWIINGSKSPSNPWQEHDTWLQIDVPYELLSDKVLEHTLKLDTTFSKSFNNWLFSVDAGLGYIWNRIELFEIVADQPKSYVPILGNNHILSSLSLSASYFIEVKK